MKPSAGLCIGSDFRATFCLSSQLKVVLDVVLEVIRVHKVFAGVVRRVDVDQLDLARIALLQQLEHFEVVAFDHQILRAVPIHAFFRTRPQSAGAWCQGNLAGAALAVPVQTVFFLRVGRRDVTDQAFQNINVEHGGSLAVLDRLGQQLRKQRLELGDVVSNQVGALRFG